MEQIITLKRGDVYDFRYNEAYLKNAFSPYHCFDGQLVAGGYDDNNLLLVDTYWSCDNRTFTLSEALEKGHLTFKFNTGDVENISEYDLEYYNDEDVFNFSHQHGCYKRWVKKKCSTKSQTKMLESANHRLSDYIREKESAERSIERIKETIIKIESGDLNIYL